MSGGKVKWLGQTFDFGTMINAVITFLIIAAVVYFAVVAPLRRLAPKKEAPPAPETETTLLAIPRSATTAVATALVLAGTDHVPVCV